MNERECDKGGRWICCGTYLKGQEKDKNEMAKEEDTEIYITQINCMECKKEFKSQEELMEHMENNECDHCRKWLSCGTYLERHKEKEHEGSKEQGKKEIGSHPNQSGDDSPQKEGKTENNESIVEIIWPESNKTDEHKIV